MPIRIRYQFQSGSTLGYSIERLSDGTFYDFKSLTFTASPVTLIASLPEDSGNFKGRYKTTLTPTSATQFTNGDYVVSIHNTVSNLVVGELAVVMNAGDDTTVIPGSGGGG